MWSRIYISSLIITILYMVLKSAALGTAIEYPDDPFHPIYTADYGKPEIAGKGGRKGNDYDYDYAGYVDNPSQTKSHKDEDHSNKTTKITQDDQKSTATFKSNKKESRLENNSKLKDYSSMRTGPTDTKTGLNREENPNYAHNAAHKAFNPHAFPGETSKLYNDDQLNTQGQPPRDFQGQSYPGSIGPNLRQFSSNMQGNSLANNYPGQAMNYANNNQGTFGEVKQKAPGLYIFKPQYNKNIQGNTGASQPYSYPGNMNIARNGQINPGYYNPNNNNFAWSDQSPGRNVQTGPSNSYPGQQFKRPDNFMSSNNKQLEHKVDKVRNETAEKEKVMKFLSTLKHDPRIVYVREDDKHPEKIIDGKVYGNIVSVDEIKKELISDFQSPANKNGKLRAKFGPDFKNPISSKYENKFVKNIEPGFGQFSYGPGNYENGIPDFYKVQAQWQQQNAPYQNRDLLRNPGNLNQYVNPQNVLRQNEYPNPQHQNPGTRKQDFNSQHPAIQNQNTNQHSQNPNQLSQNPNIQGPNSNLQSQNTNIQEPATQNQNPNLQSPPAQNTDSNSQSSPTQYQNLNPNPQFLSAQKQYANTQNTGSSSQNSPIQNQNLNPQSPSSQNINTQKLPAQNQNLNPQSPSSQITNTQNLPAQNQNLNPQSPSSQNTNTQNLPAQNQNLNPQSPLSQNINPKPQNPQAQKQNQNSQSPSSQNTHPQNPPAQNQNLNPQSPSSQNTNTQNLPAQNQYLNPQSSSSQNTNTQNLPAQNQNLNPQSPLPQNTNPNTSPSVQHPVAQNQNAYSPPQQTPSNPAQSTPASTGVDYNDIPGWYDMGIPTPTTTTTRATRPPTTAKPTPSTPSPLILNAKKVMSQKQMGFFTGYLYELFGLIAPKEYGPTSELFIALKITLDKFLDEGALVDMGNPAQQALRNALIVLVGWGPEQIQPQLQMARLMLDQRQTVLEEDIRAIVNIIDAAFTIQEGDVLLQTLVDVNDFPAYEPALEVTKKMVDAFLQPYWKTPPGNRAKLFEMINLALERRDKYETRRRNKYDEGNTDSKDNNVSGDQYHTLLQNNDEIHRSDVENNILVQNKGEQDFSRNDNYTSFIEKNKIDVTKMYKQFGVRNAEHRLEIDRRFYKSRLKSTGKKLSKALKLSESEITANKNEQKSKAIYDDGKKNILSKFLNKEIFANQYNNIKVQDRFTTNNDIEFNKPTLVTNALKQKHTKQTIKDNLKDEHSKRRHNKEQSVTNVIEITTPKLKTKPNKYDRLVQKEYNYEKSLRNRHKNNDISVKTHDKKTMGKREKPVTVAAVTATVDVKKGKTNKEKAETIVTQTKILDMVDDDTTNKTSDGFFEDKYIYNKKSNHSENKIQKNDQENRAKSKYLDTISRTTNDYHNFRGVKKTIKKKKIARKQKNVIAESSYSDEENELKTVLADAIRHSDFVFKNFRQNDDLVVEKNKIKELSSYSDEEVILKNNIYKVFGYNPDLNN